MPPSGFLNAIQRTYSDMNVHPLTTSQMESLSDRLYQLWMKPSNRSTVDENGFLAIDYLERLMNETKISDPFFILIIGTLAKNHHFFQLLLTDQQRFQRLFHSSSGSITFYLLRYIDILYDQCPSSLLHTVGLQFYRFIMDHHFGPYLRTTTHNIDWLAALSSFIHHFYDHSTDTASSSSRIWSEFAHAFDYSKATIDTFLHLHMKMEPASNFNGNLKAIDTIIKVIHFTWHDEDKSSNFPIKSSVQLESIEYLFTQMTHSSITHEHISNTVDTRKTKFSPAILSIYSEINLEAAESVLKKMLNDGQLDGKRLATLIVCLIELIGAPRPLIDLMPYEVWITGLCLALVTYDHHQSLVEVIDQTTSFLIESLFQEQTSTNAIQILFWFVRYDRRIKTYQCFVDRLPELFERFRFHSNDDLKNKCIELCHLAMLIHPNYNQKAHPYLSSIIESYPHPDLNLLSNHRQMHARFHSMYIDHDVTNRNRPGIINLGNTCYVNSVLQSLYQCDLFRRSLLQQRIHSQPILRELQLLFTRLKLSKRPSINAINLVKIARPPWFTNAEQQDCAEFLGYLLDTIGQEEKNDSCESRLEIERLFTIRTSQINRCQQCLMESIQEESTNYLFLPIPTKDFQIDSINQNQSARPLLITHSGLKFYSSLNRNANSIATSLSHSNASAFDLQSIFDRYFQKELLRDENQYQCQYCRSVECFNTDEDCLQWRRSSHSRSLQDAERYTIIQTAPEYLILSLNRFEYDKHMNVFRKVFTKINYPKVLNVNVIKRDHLSHESSPIKYCMMAVIVHTGYTLHGGHYYVYGREVKPVPLRKCSDHCVDYFTDDEWSLLNDDVVTESSYKALMDNCAQYSSATPYLLFYQRIDEGRIDAMKQLAPIVVDPSLSEKITDEL